MFMKGFLVKKDAIQGIFWTREAAIHGDALARYNMGIFCEQGDGLKKDNTTAISCYKEAAKYGHIPAKQRLVHLLEEKDTATHL
jgi:TPR repeat protein